MADESKRLSKTQDTPGLDHPGHVPAQVPCHCSPADLSAGRLSCAAAGFLPVAQEVPSSCCARSGRRAPACCPSLSHLFEQQTAPALLQQCQEKTQPLAVQVLLA